MSDILRLEVDETQIHALGAPQPVLDPTTAAVVDQKVAAARAEAFAQGEAAGRLAAVEELTALKDSIEAALTGLHDVLQQQRAEAARASLDLAEAVASAVLDRTPPDQAREVVERVRQAIHYLDPDDLQIAVHPDDHALLAADGLPAGGSWVADTTLARGEARIVGPYGGAELTRTALLDAALEVLGEDAR